MLHFGNSAPASLGLLLGSEGRTTLERAEKMSPEARKQADGERGKWRIDLGEENAGGQQSQLIDGGLAERSRPGGKEGRQGQNTEWPANLRSPIINQLK